MWCTLGSADAYARWGRWHIKAYCRIKALHACNYWWLLLLSSSGSERVLFSSSQHPRGWRDSIQTRHLSSGPHDFPFTQVGHFFQWKVGEKSPINNLMEEKKTPILILLNSSRAQLRLKTCLTPPWSEEQPHWSPTVPALSSHRPPTPLEMLLRIIQRYAGLLILWPPKPHAGINMWETPVLNSLTGCLCTHRRPEKIFSLSGENDRRRGRFLPATHQQSAHKGTSALLRCRGRFSPLKGKPALKVQPFPSQQTSDKLDECKQFESSWITAVNLCKMAVEAAHASGEFSVWPTSSLLHNRCLHLQK